MVLRESTIKLNLKDPFMEPERNMVYGVYQIQINKQSSSLLSFAETLDAFRLQQQPGC